MKTFLEKFEEKDAETSFPFEYAIEKLDKIDVQANESKKQIVRELAKSLEGKIQSDTTSMKIVNRLCGRVSARFTRECLDEKFEDLRLMLTSTVIDISPKDLSDNTKVHNADTIKDCKTHDEVFQTLNGIMPYVIARISRQVEHKILTQKRRSIPSFVESRTNSMREFASNHWRYV